MGKENLEVCCMRAPSQPQTPLADLSTILLQSFKDLVQEQLETLLTDPSLPARSLDANTDSHNFFDCSKCLSSSFCSNLLHQPPPHSPDWNPHKSAIHSSQPFHQSTKELIKRSKELQRFLSRRNQQCSVHQIPPASHQSSIHHKDARQESLF